MGLSEAKAIDIIGFPPVADKRSKVLILGTMPGSESLRRREYYAFSRNQFWRLMQDILGVRSAETYSRRLELLLENNVAIWDVVHTCSRENSEDSKIRNVVPNDFNIFLGEHPGIQSIFFNGGKSRELFEAHVLPTLNLKKVRSMTLPSTSPANTIRYEEKLRQWMEIKKAALDLGDHACQQ